MASFEVNLGIKDLQRQLANVNSYDAATQQKLRSTVQTSTTNIMLGAKRRSRVRSGQLVKNISMTYDGVKNVGVVRAKSPHAHLVEFGARGAYEIPSRRKALKIGHRFSAHAQIPQRKERPFMRPAFEDEKPNLIKNAQAAINP